ncbi:MULTISPECIES: peptidase domain-containing ABC transporter [unclassified Lysobacter]|uniref:peptidase domain-containing ABC transporter n=1 Tax=unclassified Lysobacter TaxID=2635362 RepID=UPI001BE72D3A|nr:MULTISPECIES: peptidase domain-containing ABC transporter [unclassified Lysobacter]MBT2748326.1 peptidase domain-containing ABC transporter [Lysobacter sp. ISL-42]MBT2749907.1 peptidase domain-containing ABC transporter [Lysobacter sp. ISL-50]MBT2781235.1 peptidase domain-containing ABC transporter [Lysobacter sp. ISL-52]
MQFSRKPELVQFLQVEESECGLMCLGAALSLLDAECPPAELRRRHASSVRGVTLGKLCDLAANLHLAATAVRCSVPELRDLLVPSILHWYGDHFVTLVSATRRACVIFDPALGLRSLPWTEVDRHFSGVAVQLRPTQELRPVRRPSPYNFAVLRKSLDGVGGGIGQMILLSTLLQVVNLLVPLMSQVAINFGATRGNISALTTVAICAAVAIGFSSVCELWRSLINHRIASQVATTSARQVFSKLLALPMAWHQRRRLADVVSRFDSVEPLRNAVSSGLPSLAVDGVLALVLACAMFLVSPIMGAFIVGSVMLAVVVKGALTPLVTRQGGEALQLRIREQGKRIESFRAVQTLKLTGSERAREREWSSVYEAQLAAQDRSQAWVAVQQTSAGLFGGLGNLATILYGSLLVSTGELSVGGLFAFVMYRRFLADKTLAAFDQVNALAILKFHLQRIAEVHESEPESRAEESDGKGELIPHGGVEVADLSFRHSPNDRWVLRGLNVSIKAGEFVLLTGPSGSGKSTLVRLLAGLYTPTSGDIAYDGASTSSTHPRLLRASIGAVTQEDELLGGTVLENVTVFAEVPDRDLCIEALKAAEIWQEIRELPLGLHTPVGEAGWSLSAGQRQRIILARAIYRRPRLLILDEATAHIDPSTETRIFENIRQLGSTKIVVSHQQGASRCADRHLALDHQGIREVGRLLAQIEEVA